MSTDVAMLAEVPIFELLDDSERAGLAKRMDCRDFKAGTVIFDYGDPGGEIFIVRSGRVEVYVENQEGERIIVAENERGDVMGELSFLDGGHRTATAVAREDTQVLTMHRDRLLEFIDKHPHAAIDLLTVVGRRLRATDELLRTHVSRNVNVELEEQMRLGQRVADKVASFGGSWTFIIIFGVVMLIWVTLNSAALFVRHFDPYPYILLNLLLTAMAAINAPIILVVVNGLNQRNRLKEKLDIENDTRMQAQIARLNAKLDEQSRWIEDHLDFERVAKLETETIALRKALEDQRNWIANRLASMPHKPADEDRVPAMN